MALKYHILKEYANGVMDEKGRFYPYQNNITAGDGLPAKPGIRYFIKCVSLNSINTGAVASDNEYIAATVGGQSRKIAFVSIPATFAASNDSSNLYFEPRCLTDRETAVVYSNGGVTSSCNYTYAEIFESEGEYLG